MFKTYLHGVNGFKFKLAEWEGRNGPLVGIHGLTGNHTHFAALAEKLSPDYRFLAYDLRGRGESSPADENSSFIKHADDAIALIDKMNLKKPVLIGHSMGAFIAALIASKYHNLAGLIFLDGAGVMTQEECDNLGPALARLDKVYTSPDDYALSVKPNYAAMGLPWNQYIAASVYYEISPHNNGGCKYKGDPARIMQDLRSIVYFQHEEILPKIKCPVLLVWASGKMGSSPLYAERSYEITRRLIPHLQYYVSPCNHYTLALEERPELVSIIRNFLQEYAI